MSCVVPALVRPSLSHLSFIVLVGEEGGEGVKLANRTRLSLFLCLFFPVFPFLRVFPSLAEGVKKTNMRPTHARVIVAS